MLRPFPTQISGSQWLSQQRYALLADEPRVGKTGTAIMACDENLDASILVVTTASGRFVWERAWRDWSAFLRKVQVMLKAAPATGDVVIVSWAGVIHPGIHAALMEREWDRLILDESHAAKSFEAQRTQSVYGKILNGGAKLSRQGALVSRARSVWALTGTPIPNAPNDLYPMMRALCPDRLAGRSGLPEVKTYREFLHRYCVVRLKKLPGGYRKIPVVVAGRNLPELRERLDGFMLRRTQADVGIRQPIYETLPLHVSDKVRREIDGAVAREKVLAAAEAGDTRSLTMDLGPIRRHTGVIKAHALIEAVKDEFAGGLDKVVIAFWHREVRDILRDGLASYGVVGIDGETPHKDRSEAEQRFLHDENIRVFLGQIQAAGEAIDLSSAAELIFAETSLTPKDMKQMALRITNHTQRGLPRVRVAVLRGSIDEAVEEILLRKWSAIRAVIEGDRS